MEFIVEAKREQKWRVDEKRWRGRERERERERENPNRLTWEDILRKWKHNRETERANNRERTRWKARRLAQRFHETFLSLCLSLCRKIRKKSLEVSPLSIYRYLEGFGVKIKYSEGVIRYIQAFRVYLVVLSLALEFVLVRLHFAMSLSLSTSFSTCHDFFLKFIKQ